MSEVYSGIKFKAEFSGLKFGFENERKAIYNELKKLHKKGVLEANNGNISLKVSKGMVITPSGIDMEKLKPEDMVLVTGTNEKEKTVSAVGKNEPSSESIMHWEIYQKFSDASAIIHFHDDNLIALQQKFTATKKYYPYGTIELAYEVLKSLEKSPFIIIKDHGALVIGSDLKECNELIEKEYKKI